MIFQLIDISIEMSIIKYKHGKNKWITVKKFFKIPNDVIEIDCSNNNISILPDWFNYANLRIINCSGNELTTLPDWQHLNNLEEIDCSYNQLKKLPEWKYLTNLQIIKCGHNLLTNLPKWDNLINYDRI